MTRTKPFVRAASNALRDDLEKRAKSLVGVELAFSRAADRPKEHVQEPIRARRDDVARLLLDPEDDHVCDLHRNEEGVLTAFAKVADGPAVRSPSSWRRERRSHLESRGSPGGYATKATSNRPVHAHASPRETGCGAGAVAARAITRCDMSKGEARALAPRKTPR